MSSRYTYEIPLVVGSGELPAELELGALGGGLSFESEQNDDQNGLSVYPQKSESLPNVTLYESGKYTVRAGSEEELFEVNERVVLNEMERLSIINGEQKEQVQFDIVNVVGNGNIGYDIDLPKLAIGLGLKHAEYESEQFPAVQYERDYYGCKFLIFGNGKIVAPGANSEEESREAFDRLYDELMEWEELLMEK